MDLPQQKLYWVDLIPPGYEKSKKFVGYGGLHVAMLARGMKIKPLVSIGGDLPRSVSTMNTTSY